MPPLHAPGRILAPLLALGLATGAAHAQGTPSPSPTSPAPAPTPTSTSTATATSASNSAGASEPAPAPVRRSFDPESLEVSRLRRNAERARGTTVRFRIPGDWQIRGWALSALPLATTPGQSEPAQLGQQWFLEQWFRFSPELTVGDNFQVVGQFDVARGIVAGDVTQQVELSRDARSATVPTFTNDLVFDPRWLFIDWTTPIGVVRAGQQGSHWGLGIVANDGNHRPVFGDYRMGDIVERVAFATRPGGRSSDLVVAIAGDLVYRDRLARLLTSSVRVTYDVAPREVGGDWAWQGILSAFWQDHACHTDCERKRVGVYGVYRDQHNALGDYLRVFVLDAFARWEWPTPDGSARVFGALEVAGIAGWTNMAATREVGEQVVAQFGGAAQVGIERAGRYQITLEGGYASGDRNPADGAQRGFVFNPDHRVGLIMFPEVLAWQTARSASIATDERILGRPQRGAGLLPTSGGVTNAMYLYPTAVINLRSWLDLRLGAVLAVAATDMVDPVQVVLTGNARNYRGGDARNRDLGLELDAGLGANQPLGGGVTLSGGVHGGVLFPGHAFDSGDPDPARRGLPMQWLVQGRLGLSF